MKKQISPYHFFVYILECSDETFYTGYCRNLESRLKVHNQGKASKYTRARLPVSMIYSETCLNRSVAMKREAQIKKLSRAQKESLRNL